MHTAYSDGKNTPEEMVISAIGKGFRRIAITDHCPLPFENEYATRIDDLPQYLAELRYLQNKYSKKIEILSGIELDYLPTEMDWIRKIGSAGFDYIIGSVHFTYDKNSDKYLESDAGQEGVQEIIDRVFAGDVKSFCKNYFQSIEAIAESGLYNTIGHFDLIKKYNKNNCLFDETEGWYSELVCVALDKIKESDMQMDLNTSGFDRPVGVQYPSDWIIRAAIERGIEFVPGSDAHRAENIGRNFNRIPRLVK